MTYFTAVYFSYGTLAYPLQVAGTLALAGCFTGALKRLRRLKWAAWPCLLMLLAFSPLA